MYAYMLSCFSHVQLSVTLWTVDLQAPLSMGFSRQEYWIGFPCPPPGGLPKPGIEPTSLISPALIGGFFTTSTIGEAQNCCMVKPKCKKGWWIWGSFPGRKGNQFSKNTYISCCSVHKCDCTMPCCVFSFMGFGWLHSSSGGGILGGCVAFCMVSRCPGGKFDH